MLFPVNTLIHVDSGGNCPTCGDEYHITTFNMHKWYDCVKCGKNKEELEGDKK